MNCQEALSRLYEMIDREVSEIDEKEIKRHIEHCHHCFELYRMENAIQDFIGRGLANCHPTDNLDGLKTLIRSKLDEVDGQQAVGEGNECP